MRTLTLIVGLVVAAVLAAPAAAQDRQRGRWKRMKRYDTDHDGEVTREEFGGPARMLDRMDHDGDGVVTEAEAVRGQGSRGASGSASEGGRGTADIDWVTKRLDVDRDGTFDARDLAKILETADKDSDEALSRKELLDFLTHADRPIPRGTAPAEAAAAPDFEVRALEGTGTIKLASLLAKKRPVVIAFGSLT